MTKRILLLLLTLGAAAVVIAWSAEDESSAKAELDELVAEISGKVAAGARTEEALADDIVRLDGLYEKFSGEKTDEVARILVMKALLYVQVIRNPEAAIPVFEKIKTDFEGMEPAKQAASAIEDIKAELALAVGKPFPDFAVEDLDGDTLSLADYKGKVVLVDFWATWCGPCVEELPSVLVAYNSHKDAGFDIVGISLDSNERKLNGFIEEHGMPWRQYFDGKGWKNELARKYGVKSIPATFLLDGNGTIIGKDLRGPALEKAVAAAVGQ